MAEQEAANQDRKKGPRSGHKAHRKKGIGKGPGCQIDERNPHKDDGDKIVEKRIDGFFSCTEVAAKRKMDSRKDCVKDVSFQIGST